MTTDELTRIAQELPFELGLAAARIRQGMWQAPSLALRPDDVFPAASVIKIPIALTVLDGLDPTERLLLREEDKVIGSGVLTHLSAGLALPVADLLYLATAISDNTATNLLVERVGLDAVNGTLERLGCTSTRLTGLILADESRGTDTPHGKGESSPSTPADLLRILQHAAEHPALLALLRRTQTASAIGRGLPDDRFLPDPPVKLAYKTGSIRGVVAEAAIVETREASYAVAIMTKGVADLRPTPDNVARVAIARLSAAIHAHFTS